MLTVFVLLFCSSSVRSSPGCASDCQKLTEDNLKNIDELIKLCSSCDFLFPEKTSAILVLDGATDYQVTKLMNAKKTVDMSIQIHHSNLSTIHLLKLIKLNSRSEDFVLSIQNNLILEFLNLPLLTGIGGANDGKIIVRGNRKLEESSLEHLRGMMKGDASFIQDFGDCYFETPPTAVSELSNCKAVSSDLQLPSDATDDNLPQNIKKIYGCVVIKDTQITNLDFLRKIDVIGPNCASNHEISENGALCVYSTDEKHFKEKDTAHSAKFERNLGPNCNDPMHEAVQNDASKIQYTERPTTTAAPKDLELKKVEEQPEKTKEEGANNDEGTNGIIGAASGVYGTTILVIGGGYLILYP